MTDQTLTTRPPKSFYWIAGAAFVWDLMGVVAYLSTVMMSPDVMGAMSEAERALYENTPAWSTGAFAIAAHGGLLGTLLLLLRKALALPVLVISLVAVVINTVYTWFLTDAYAVLGVGQAVFAAIILAIAAFLVWFASDAKQKGWIS